MNWREWHWFWAKVFGQRVPTSGERAHIGNLVLKIGRLDPSKFGREWLTDARKVYIIGELTVFDYGDTPFAVIEQTELEPPRDLGDHDDLLRENIRQFGRKE